MLIVLCTCTYVLIKKGIIYVAKRSREASITKPLQTHEYEVHKGTLHYLSMILQKEEEEKGKEEEKGEEE